MGQVILGLTVALLGVVFIALRRQTADVWVRLYGADRSPLLRNPRLGGRGPELFGQIHSALGGAVLVGLGLWIAVSGLVNG